jgi:hypothetical protein
VEHLCAEVDELKEEAVAFESDMKPWTDQEVEPFKLGSFFV